jgi:hypothetical protein
MPSNSLPPANRSSAIRSFERLQRVTMILLMRVVSHELGKSSDEMRSRRKPAEPDRLLEQIRAAFRNSPRRSSPNGSQHGRTMPWGDADRVATPRSRGNAERVHRHRRRRTVAVVVQCGHEVFLASGVHPMMRRSHALLKSGERPRSRRGWS